MNGLALLVPAGLLALISVPLVVLFHMRSPTPKAIPVPAIRFWRVAAPKPTDEPRFQGAPITPSLVIHIAAALLLSLALARPVSSFALGAVNASTEPHHLIVILDGSTSMLAVDGDKSRFDLARKQALDQLGGLHADDAATVLILGNTMTTYSASDTGSMQALKDRLGSLDAPGGVADLTSALLLAHDLHVPGMENDITLITDGALEVDPTAAANTGMPITYLRVGNPDAGNLAIVGISARANPSNPAEQLVSGRLVNFSGQPATVPVQFLADNIVITNDKVQVDANSQIDLLFSAPKGSAAAEIRIVQNDTQPLDDRAAIVLAADQALALKVLIFSDNPQPLQLAFGSIPGAQVTVETTDVVAEGYGTGGYDLVVYDEVAPTKPPAAPSLFIQPPDSPLFPSPGMLADSTPTQITQSDPLLQEDVEFAGVTFGATPRYELPAGFTTVVAATDGPLLAYGVLPGGESPAVLLAGNLKESNLTQRIAFPILMMNVAQKLSPSPAPQTLSLGEPLLITPRIGATAVTVTDPNGDATTIETPDTEGLSQSARQISYGQTNLIGAYRLRETDAQDQTLVTGMVTVNAGNVTESDLRANPDLGGLLAQATATAEAVAKSDRQADLWPILALLALALMIADWLLSLRSPQFSSKQLARSKGGAA